MNKIRTAPVAVLPVTNKIVDVFVGEGWEQHSRFSVVKGHPKLISGAPLTQEQYDAVRAAVAQ